jgi:hypothetical protein
MSLIRHAPSHPVHHLPMAVALCCARNGHVRRCSFHATEYEEEDQHEADEEGDCERERDRQWKE